MECAGAQPEKEMGLAQNTESSMIFKDYLFDQRTAFFIEEIKKYKQESLDKDEEIKELKTSNRKFEDDINRLRVIVKSLTEQRERSMKRTKNNDLLQTLADMVQNPPFLHNGHGQIKDRLNEAAGQLKDFEYNLTRKTRKTESRACQTVHRGVSLTEDIASANIEEMEDSLMMDLFYLPKDPELPDLRLFDKI